MRISWQFEFGVSLLTIALSVFLLYATWQRKPTK